MWHVCKWASVFIIIAVNCPANAAEPDPIQIDAQSENATTPVVTDVPQDLHYDKPDNNMPFISINTDSALDLNWAAALEFTDPALRPTPVTLPFLTDYPIDNLEIKLRFLNLKF